MKGGKKMEKGQLWTIVGVALVVAVVASIATAFITGNVISVAKGTAGKVYTTAETYSKAEVNNLISKLSMPRYAGCTSIGVEGGTGDSACAIENKTCKFGFKVWSRHNENDFGTEGSITDVIPVVSDCSTNWGINEGQDQVVNYLCC
jgi:hypothetical protein